MKITLKVAAKINLMLDLTSIFENGYHCIHTVMQSVGVYDTITLTQNDSEQITLSCDKYYIPTDSRNTAYKSAQLFFKKTGIKNKGLHINIKKDIPCQAGMAGGSADSAGVLAGLNKMYGNPLNEKQLIALGSQIGADVPFCLTGGTALCTNIGDVMAPLHTMELYSVIVKPKQGVSTKEAYSLYDKLENVRHCDRDRFIYYIQKQDYKNMCKYAVNVFEQAIELSERVPIKTEIRKFNTGLTMMTGSGSAIFGLFDKKEDCEKCAKALKEKWHESFFAPFLNKSILFE